MPPKELSPQLVLASQSPRRAELLALTGLPFTQKCALTDESHRAGESPAQYSLRLAREKADKGAQIENDDCLVLAADTIVVHNNAILGKPANAKEAERMLRDLQGKIHTVITAFVLTWSNNTREGCCSTQVQIRQLSPKERMDYIASGDPFDKAGAYGIQNRQFQPATTLSGCVANVMGLPICQVVRALSEAGLTNTADLASKCAATTGFDCQINQTIRVG